MQYAAAEKNMLESVNQIGLKITEMSEDSFIFIQLSPYLDHLMAFLKRLNQTEMQMLFMEYKGVMKAIRTVEECAQKMEKELGLK